MATVDEMRREIARLERIWRGISDQQTRDALREMIEELEARIRDAGDDDTESSGL